VKTLLPGRRVDLFIQRDGEQYQVQLKLGGLHVRFWHKREELRAIAHHILANIGDEVPAPPVSFDDLASRKG